LQREARRRRIRIGSYGPCTPELMRLDWLERDCASDDGLALFRSV
jgi:hypothetical protein